MNREEAIYFANCLKNNYTVDLNDMEAFCGMAIKALEQEPTTKNDLGVDKFDKAINQSDLEEWIMETFPDWCEGDVRLIMNHMDEMPSVTPQESRWISVSERLPEDRREVLVTAYWHETYQVMMASYYGDGLWWCVPFNNCGEHMQRLKPKAWMPLPHKAESEKA